MGVVKVAVRIGDWTDNKNTNVKKNHIPRKTRTYYV